MIERLTRKQTGAAFPTGAPVILLVGTTIAESTHNGLISEWSGRTCAVEMAPCLDLQVPVRGSRIEIVSARLDGVYRVPGEVTAIQREDVPEGQPAGRILHIEVDLDRARRVQQRQFFRLNGGWRATIRANEKEGAQKPGVPTMIWNLSASGMLIEDPERRLLPGDLFSVAIDLRDGGLPLRLRAVVVRRDNRSSDDSPQWGCRFLDPTEEDERRIIHHLQERIRSRFAVKSRAYRSPSEESA